MRAILKRPISLKKVSEQSEGLLVLTSIFVLIKSQITRKAHPKRFRDTVR